MSEQALDMRSAVAVLKRRKRIVVGAGLIGLAAGLTFAILQPPKLSSTTLILLPTPTTSSGQRDIATEIKIITSASILNQAGAALKPALSSKSVLELVRVEASTTQLIQITASGATAKNATTLAQAMANSYIDYENQSSSSVSTTALTGLTARRDQLQKSVDSLQDELSATTKRMDSELLNSTSGRKDAQLKAELESQQADVTLQLDKIKEQMMSGLPSQTSAATPSLVQPASPALEASRILPSLSWAILGFLAASVMVSGVLLARARGDRHVRLRDEIADALGSSVLASVRSRPSKSAAGWSLLLQSYDAGPVEEWAYRQLLRSLVHDPAPNAAGRRGGAARLDHPASLTVVTLADDLRGLAIGPQMAAFTASRGVVTRLITTVGGGSAASLWAACSAQRGGPLRPNLVVGEVRPGETAELTVVLAVVDRINPQFGYSLRTEHTLLAIGAGQATSEELARVAVALDDAGGSLDGIIVADPDQADWTTGRHTAEERVKQVALPIRITGRPADVPSDGGSTRR